MKKGYCTLTYRTRKTQRNVDPHHIQRNLYRRSLIVVVISQMFGGAGLAAGVTVGALLAQDMLGTESSAGVPSALLTFGSAVASLLIGRFSQRFGRRSGLGWGFIAGGIGAIGVIFSAVISSVPLLFLSLFIYGAGTAANLQARYAGTDLAKPNQRAKAISIAMVSTTLGAVAGPNMVGMTGRFAASFGLPVLTGLFILAAVSFILAGIVLLLFLRPDPLITAKTLSVESESESQPKTVEKKNSSPKNNKGLVVGAAVMVLTQVVMVAIMTMTPIHMKHHGFSLEDVGVVIGIHVGLMYLPSLFTGILVDKIGRTAMSIASGFVLLFAGLVAALAPANSQLLLILALALLGLGWNIGLISGTALIVDATDPADRAKKQGAIDVLVALAGAAGGISSGVVAAYTSYSFLSFACGALALGLIPVVLWSRKRKQKVASVIK
ncbi:MFS family permease [Paenibacillus mucilaginosus]|uniref:MFS transporter n=1 Tax=Paenibacillus mucilaginosus TaxID=61624 RepID=UPI003D1F4BBA